MSDASVQNSNKKKKAANKKPVNNNQTNDFESHLDILLFQKKNLSKAETTRVRPKRNAAKKLNVSEKIVHKMSMIIINYLRVLEIMVTTYIFPIHHPKKLLNYQVHRHPMMMMMFYTKKEHLLHVEIH